MEKSELKKWLKISLTSSVILIVSLGLGLGAIKLYQLIDPAQLNSGDETAFVDPVKDIRQTCSNLRKSPDSQLYGDTSRKLPGDQRQVTTFTGLARVIQTEPVVLDFDTASIRPTDNPVFDAAAKKIPTRQFTVTDSAVFGLKMGQVIRASVDYSQPKSGEGADDLAEADKEVAVKLQNALVIEDQQKHGIFAENFTIYAAPPEPNGIIYMASGDVYSYNQSDSSSGIENVQHNKNTGTAWVAQQLAGLKLYSKKGDIISGPPAVYCGYGYTSKDGLNDGDSQIILNTLGY